MAPKRVVNTIAEHRQLLDMSQEGLAIRAGTSQQQISRIEKGQQTNIAMARAIAEALRQPLGSIFPELGDDPSAEGASDQSGIGFHDRIKKAGLDFGGDPVNWQLTLRMRGIDEPFIYVVEHSEAERVHVSLEDRLHVAQRTVDDLFLPNFLVISPQGRLVVIHADDILSISFGEWDQAPELDDSFASTRVFLRGQNDPTVLDDVDELRAAAEVVGQAFWPSDEQYQNWERWRILANSPIAYQFVQIHDFTDEEDVFFNISDIVLAEAPTKDLIDELFREERHAHELGEKEMFEATMGISMDEYLAQRAASGKSPQEFDREFQERRKQVSAEAEETP